VVSREGFRREKLLKSWWLDEIQDISGINVHLSPPFPLPFDPAGEGRETYRTCIAPFRITFPTV